KVFADVVQSVRADGVLNGRPIGAQLPMNTIVQRFSISHGVNLLTANLVFGEQFFRHPGEKLGRVLVSVRFGAGTTIPHAESAIQGHINEHYQFGSPALQAAAGAQVRLLRHLYWMGEYKYTRTRQHVNVFSGTA